MRRSKPMEVKVVKLSAPHVMRVLSFPTPERTPRTTVNPQRCFILFSLSSSLLHSAQRFRLRYDSGRGSQQSIPHLASVRLRRLGVASGVSGFSRSESPVSSKMTSSTNTSRRAGSRDAFFSANEYTQYAFTIAASSIHQKSACHHFIDIWEQLADPLSASC